MWEPVYFVQVFFDLIAYCNDDKLFNLHEFKRRHDEYSKKYAKLSQEDQGFIAEQINKQ